MFINVQLKPLPHLKKTIENVLKGKYFSNYFKIKCVLINTVLTDVSMLIVFNTVLAFYVCFQRRCDISLKVHIDYFLC